jgi:hypothetical protein
MKFNELRSIGHNIADSLASGVSMLVGQYDLDIFAEARAEACGYIEVDFLAGTSTGSAVSPLLARAISTFPEILPKLCEQHAVKVSVFRRLSARFSASPLGPRFVVTVEDLVGRTAVDEYEGLPGRRARILDPLGRVRPRRGTVTR